MSLHEHLDAELRGLNVHGLTIDTVTTDNQVKARKISFTMTNPLGLDTGALNFEIWFDTSYLMSDYYMAASTREHAIQYAKAYLMENST